ncbi:Non-specific lipid transfer protein GPI-anchored 31 [Linum perenne]
MAFSSSYLPLFLLSALLFLSASNAAHHHSAAAPAPAADCSTVVLSLSDCLNYVLKGSTTTKPEGTCCSGLKSVLKTDAACLCQAFQSSGTLGVPLNMTKALTLPSACKLQAPPMSACQRVLVFAVSMAPAGAPGMSSGSTAVPPSGSAEGGELAQAPAPSPVGTGLTTGYAPAFIPSSLGASFLAATLLVVAASF